MGESECRIKFDEKIMSVEIVVYYFELAAKNFPKLILISEWVFSNIPSVHIFRAKLYFYPPYWIRLF